MKKNNKGFTLAELLIVVAIIAVLVAIAIPIFSAQLEKSKEATDIANIRSAYAAVAAENLLTGSASSVTVEAKQGQPGWQTSPEPGLEVFESGSTSTMSIVAQTAGNDYTVAITSSGVITVG